MQSGTKLSDHHHLIVGRQSHDVDAVLEISNEEIMDLAGLLRSKPLSSKPEQPVFHQGLIAGPRGFADP